MVSVSGQRKAAFSQRKFGSHLEIFGYASSQCLACHHRPNDSALLPHHDNEGAHHQLPPAEEHAFAASFSLDWRKMERGVQIRLGAQFSVFELRRQLLVCAIKIGYCRIIGFHREVEPDFFGCLKVVKANPTSPY